MKTFKYPTLSILLFLALFPSWGQAYDITFSVGNLCEYIGKIQTNDSGRMNVCNFKPYFASSYDYTLWPNFILSPEVGISLPSHGRDENITKTSFTTLLNTKYIYSNYHAIFGVGLFITSISGDGGTQDLNNGSGMSAFPKPDGTIYSRNFIINLGLGVDFQKVWSADLHTYVFNLIHKEDRAFSVAINGTYHFGEF